jgi:hypothetical protein
MSKLSSQEIQMFVAGVLALMGFYGLYWLPYFIFMARDTVQILSHVGTALALPLGIGMFMGSARAVLLARIYLWLEVILGMVCVPIICFELPSRAIQLVWQSGPDFVISAVLLVLILWSRLSKFRHDEASLHEVPPTKHQ